VERLRGQDSEFLYFAATVLAACEQEAMALVTLREAVAANYCSFPAIDLDPTLAPLRESPEFAAVRDEARACRERFVAAAGL